LNLTYYIADENILHLGPDTEAVLARYSRKEGKPYLLLVKYPSTHHAKRAFGSFLNAYMPDVAKQGIVRVEDGKWTAADVYSTLMPLLKDWHALS
jgi:hypothetical protein